MREIKTDLAPKAIGPYSQAVVIDNTLFTSGQIPINPKTLEIAEGIELQAKTALENLTNLVKESGFAINEIVKTTVFVKNMDDFAKVNEIYETFFEAPYPARSCVEVARLPKDVLIEVEAIAKKDK